MATWVARIRQGSIAERSMFVVFKQVPDIGTGTA
jgi:hypothetical protein